MVPFKTLLILYVGTIAITTAHPKKNLDHMNGLFSANSVEEMRSLCAESNFVACLQLKAITFIEGFFQKDSIQIGDNAQLLKNSYRSNEIKGRSEESFEEKITEFIKGHDALITLPGTDSSIRIDARSLDNEEIDINFNFPTQQGEARKAKLKKIITPILVFLLLKAITLVPLALGILGYKAWSALQLSFLSFIVSVGLSIFQLCKKIAADNTHFATHSAWDGSYGSNYVSRSLNENKDKSHMLAYNAQIPQ